MSFYDEWLKCLREEHNDKQFLKAFLLSEDYTIQPLIEGDSEDIVTAIKLLLAYPLEQMLETIGSFELNYNLQPKDIPCFSNFQNGSTQLSSVLMFFPDGLTFDTLGYQLMKSNTKGARVKYGENHAKLAEIMNLVTISEDRPAIVQSTSLGKNIATIIDETKKK